MTGSSESSVHKLLQVPGMQRVPHRDVALFRLRGFLEPKECETLIGLIDRDRRPSTIADDNGDAAFRTSETCDLPDDLAEVAALEDRLSALSGIAPQYGEPLQGQRYAPGQEFKPHTDYFDPDGADFQRFCAVVGQRTWTYMIYLNAVEAGGGTRFTAIGKTFKPEVGTLLCWNNRLPDGSVNPATIHHGMKVRKGTKYIITKWYRERPWR